MNLFLRIYISLATIAVIVSCGAAHAQQDMTLHYMTNLFEASKTNPALQSNNKFGIQTALINLNFGLYNSGFYPKQLTQAQNQDSPGAYLVGKLDDKNYLTNVFSIDLLAFHFKVKTFDFSFNASENYNFRLGYPRDLFGLAWFGNGDDYYLKNNKPVVFDGLGVNMQLYHELGFGVSQTIKQKFTYGVKYKYLIGVATVNTARSNGSLYTDNSSASAYGISAKTDILLQTAGDGGLAKLSLNNLAGASDLFYTKGADGKKNFDMNKLDLKNILLSQNNRGHAFDFGVSYKPTEKWTINASVINLGFIDWKKGARQFTSNKDSVINGITLTDLSIPKNPDSAFVNSLKKTFKLKEDSTSSFRTLLTPQIYLSGYYNINKKNKVGLLLTAEYFNNSTIRPGFTAGYTKTFGRALDIALTYSYFNRNPYNVGIGAALRFWCFESYFITDNVFGMVVPAYASNINFRLGTNLIFGRDGKKVKQPKIKDKDGDGIPDNIDLCPTIPGVASAKGCPDADNDSIPDSEDSCKTVPGLRQFHGCPDTDGDGIPDYLDRCPTVFGLAAFKGCPDTDGDSIPDLEDSCRTVKGLKQFHGCPDTDGDGIPDYMDACPYQFGPVIFHGCPDSDGDSIPDNLDECPTVKGVKENNGCPKAEPTKAQLTKEEEEVINKVFSNLEFENGKATIKESSYPALEALYDLMNKKAKFKLNVFGYTDNVGSKQSNMKLSKQRADAIKTYLTGKGIDGARVNAEGFGPSNPIAPNTTPDGRAKNRRVEFTILE